MDCARKLQIVSITLAFVITVLIIMFILFFVYKQPVTEQKIDIDFSALDRAYMHLENSWLGMPAYALVLPARRLDFLKTNCFWKLSTTIINAPQPGKDNCSTGWKCCSLGHARMYRYFLESGEHLGLFLEDDVMVNSDYYDDLKHTIDDIRTKLAQIKKPLICYLGYNRATVTQSLSPNLQEGTCYCTHAYIMNRPGAQVVLRYAETMAKPIDTQLIILVKEKKIASLISTKKLFIQNRGKHGSCTGNPTLAMTSSS